MKYLKYFLGFVAFVLVIGIVLMLVVVFSFNNGGRRPECYDNSAMLDSLKLTDKKYYTLGKYRIYPSEKKILTCYDECTPYYIDSLVNFDSTTLVFYGNTFNFEEHLDSLTDYNTLKVLYYNIEKDYPESIYKDKGNIYNGITGDKIDISGLKCINDWIYLDNGDEIFYLTKGGELYKMDIYDQRPYLSDLEYLFDGCLFNKDGLYQLQKQYNYKDERNIWFTVPVKIEGSGGQKTTPIVKPYYFIFGKSVYLRQMNSGQNEQKFQKLDMDAAHLKEFILSDSYSYSYMLTDGKNTYVYPERLKSKINANSISQWRQLSRDNQRFTYDEKTNVLYYASNHLPEIGRSISGALICIGNNFWLINFSGYDEDKGKMISLDKVMIDAGTGYEELNIDSYRYIDADLYLYKNLLYGNRCTLVEECRDMNLSDFQPILHNGISTKYFTDGKILFYNDEIRSYTMPHAKGVASRVVTGVDFGSLKVISKTMLIDKNNIYSGIMAIPIDSLGIKVKVYI